MYSNHREKKPYLGTLLFVALDENKNQFAFDNNETA
jgi:hypothetical protein